jgi:hypothetical protein
MFDLTLLVDYIERKLSADDFRNILLCDEILCEQISRVYNNAVSPDNCHDYRIISCIKRYNFAKKEAREILDAIVESILVYCGQSYTKPQNEKKEIGVSNILLSYLSDDSMAEQFVFEKIFKLLPLGLSISEQKKICKDKQKGYFLYEKKSPKWIQSGEWQFDEKGEPMIFIGQRKDKDDSHATIYTFRSKSSDHTVEVKQYD